MVLFVRSSSPPLESITSFTTCCGSFDAAHICVFGTRQSQFTDLVDLLQKKIGFVSFHPFQSHCLTDFALQRRDVVAFAQVGSGKSFLIWLAPLVQWNNVLVIVEPLSSIILEQIDKIHSLMYSTKDKQRAIHLQEMVKHRSEVFNEIA